MTGGAAFGGNGALVPEERALGRRLALVRTYYRIGRPFPTSADRSLMRRGTSLVVSLDMPPGMTYGAVAGGREDSRILSFLHSMTTSAKQDGLKAIYFCFEHEPDTRLHGSNPAAFVQAWHHVHNLAVSAHLDWQQGGLLHWVWILTADAFDRGVAASYWPGGRVVDVVGVDAYNTAGCKRAPSGTNYVATVRPVSPASLFGSAESFATSKGDALFITEWASVPGPAATSRSRFIQAVAQYVGAHEGVFAAMYWDGHGHGNACDYSINGSPGTLSALGSLGRSPRFRGSVTGGQRA